MAMNKREMIESLQDKQHKLSTFWFRNRAHIDAATTAIIEAECRQLELLELALKEMSYAQVAIVRNYYGIPPKGAVQASNVQLTLF
jgi:hypothetical protein